MAGATVWEKLWLGNKSIKEKMIDCFASIFAVFGQVLCCQKAGIQAG
jgi:hypothetical protein